MAKAKKKPAIRPSSKQSRARARPAAKRTVAAAAARDTSAGAARRLQQMERRLARLEDVHAVRTLHFKYGYYIDMCLYDEACELFAEDAQVRFLNGVYKGKAGARRLYCDWFRNLFTNGHNGPIHGFLLDHLQLQDIVDVAADGKSAKGRFRALLMAGQHESKKERVGNNFPTQCWEGGIYENLYVQDRGVWKIKLLNYNMLWQADYGPGWANSGVHLPALTRLFPDDPHGPDELLPSVPHTWPHTRVVPFHYAHPVTGKAWR